MNYLVDYCTELPEDIYAGVLSRFQFISIRHMEQYQNPVSLAPIIKKGGRMANGRDGFIVETTDDYVMLQSIPMEPRCTCERISKKNVEEFVVKWARFYLRVKIPYDISALCDYIRENQDNFEGVRQYMLKFMRSVYSYKL